MGDHKGKLMNAIIELILPRIEALGKKGYNCNKSMILLRDILDRYYNKEYFNYELIEDGSYY